MPDPVVKVSGMSTGMVMVFHASGKTAMLAKGTPFTWGKLAPTGKELATELLALFMPRLEAEKFATRFMWRAISSLKPQAQWSMDGATIQAQIDDMKGAELTPGQRQVIDRERPPLESDAMLSPTDDGRVQVTKITVDGKASE